MDYAKKIPLTEHNIQPLVQQPVIEQGQPPTIRSHLDFEMSRILRSEVPDDEKAKLYSNALRRYRFYHEPASKPDPVAQMTNQMLPQHMIKATRLLKYLKPYINFNEDFELVYDGQTIPLSNVVKLAENAVQRKTGEKPIGWAEFADVLKRERWDGSAHFEPGAMEIHDT